MKAPEKFEEFLKTIEEAQPELEKTLIDWSEINSGSGNIEGLKRMGQAIMQEFSALNAALEVHPLKPEQCVDTQGEIYERELGECLLYTQRPEAPLQILLTGHMDTVFGPENSFQKCRMDDDKIHGPGVADMKGGLLVMLTALKTLESCPWRSDIGYRVLISPDEEISSPGSAPLLLKYAKHANIGLTYEPALADGTLAGDRKGSGNFSLIIKGVSAHAGRSPELGRNAIYLASVFFKEIYSLNNYSEGVSVNPAKIDGGGANNVVPDMAVCRFNVRVKTREQQIYIEESLDAIIGNLGQNEGFKLELKGGFSRPPKILSQKNIQLFNMLAESGEMLNIPIRWQPTGGCCEGNNLAAAGLPNIDTLGVCGNYIHSDKEYAVRQSLIERSKLSALLLLRLACGDIELTF